MSALEGVPLFSRDIRLRGASHEAETKSSGLKFGVSSYKYAYNYTKYPMSSRRDLAINSSFDSSIARSISS